MKLRDYGSQGVVVSTNTVASIPRVSPQSRRYVNQVLEFGIHNTRSLGFGAQLEEKFCQRFGRRFGILHSNGTTTMHSALLAAEVGVGDEVIVPAFTVFMTASVVLYANAVPIVADVDPETWTIDPEDIRRKITPRTKAIIPVSICGLAPDYDAILQIARQNSLTVIEDNAQCFLGKYRDGLVGSFGKFASFSFQGSKHMTCGEGGILLCDDEALATRARKAASAGFSTLTARPGDSVVPKEIRCHPSFQRHDMLGYNFRMSELAIAMALGEFERLDELVAMRRSVANVFNQVVGECDWLVTQNTPEQCEHSWWTYGMRITRDDLDWSDLRSRFVELGGDGYYGAYQPLHREPVFPKLSDAVRENPERYPQWAGRLPDYRAVHCPIWESIQPRIILLKTNYCELAQAEQQAEILREWIRCFS
jgi:perosamine synthetase